ncbi:hypothetical protein U1Q18_022757 [Sarracenia purpurea var. burkii]
MEKMHVINSILKSENMDLATLVTPNSLSEYLLGLEPTFDALSLVHLFEAEEKDKTKEKMAQVNKETHKKLKEQREKRSDRGGNSCGIVAPPAKQTQVEVLKEKVEPLNRQVAHLNADLASARTAYDDLERNKKEAIADLKAQLKAHKEEQELIRKSEESEQVISQRIAEHIGTSEAKAVYPGQDFNMVDPEDDDTSTIAGSP